MPKYVKWEVANKSQSKYNIGNKKFSFGKQGISTVDIIVIVIASIAIISSGFFLYKNVTTLNKVVDEIDAMKITVQSKQDTIARLAELGNNEQDLQNKYDRNELYIPTEKSSEGVMKDIDDILADKGIMFVSLQYSDNIQLNDGVIDMPFTLRVQGTYEQINDALSAFTKTNRLYVIDSVNSIKANNDSEDISAEILMHTYYKPN